MPGKKRKNNPAGCFFDVQELVVNPKIDSGVFVIPVDKNSHSRTSHHPNTTEAKVTAPVETWRDFSTNPWTKLISGNCLIFCLFACWLAASCFFRVCVCVSLRKFLCVCACLCVYMPPVSLCLLVRVYLCAPYLCRVRVYIVYLFPWDCH